MFRFVYLSMRWYAVFVEDGLNDEDEVENLRSFIEGGDLVVLSPDLETFLSMFGVDEDEVEVIE